jgi:hypothetical protein
MNIRHVFPRAWVSNGHRSEADPHRGYAPRQISTIVSRA